MKFSEPQTGERWAVITRWDYRVKIDGKYLGYANRELREVYVRQEEHSDGWLITGDARLLGATKKDGYPVAARLEDSERIRFILGHDGSVLESGNNYPGLRGFPTFPDGVINPGDTWESPLGVLVYGPKGEKAVLTQFASYHYLGIRPYLDTIAHFFDVSWAIRYSGTDPDVSSFLEHVEGSHRVSLVVDIQSRTPIMARDSLKETWRWADSRIEEREGFALIFWDGIPPLDRGGVRREFEDQFSGTGDIIIAETPGGVSVTLRNLHFQPDLALLLPEDFPLLDDLAGIISRIPDRTVLIRGHTADVGRPDEQYQLSGERARTIADELAVRGIDSRRLIYEGVGADEPLASNDTDEGRRQNRRVEFLILED